MVTSPPIKSLFDFARAKAIRPQETRLVTIALTPRDRSLVTERGEWSVPQGTFSVECEAGGIANTGVETIHVAA